MRTRQAPGKRDLTVGDVKANLIFFAAPLLISSVLQTAYNLIDMVVVGHFVGSNGLAAVTIGSDVSQVLLFVAMGFANAGQILIAQAVGAQRDDKVDSLVGTLFVFLGVAAVCLTAVCVVFRHSILGWINTPVEAYQYTLQFVVVSSAGLPFIYGYNLVSAILRGMGDSKSPLKFIVVSVSGNIVLDLVFVGLLGWEVLGAALATLIAQAVAFVWSMTFLYRHKVALGVDISISNLRIRKDSLVPLMKLGIPMVLQSAAISTSKLFITSWVNSYGVTATAVSGIGNKIQMFAGVFGQALSAAGSAMIAQHVGAKKQERIPAIIGTSLLLNAVVAGVLTIITLLAPRAVFSVFTTDEEVLTMAMTFVPVLLLFYGSCVLRPPMLALINGTGNYSLNLTIALLDGIFVRVGLSLLLGLVFNMGVYGFWYGAALASFMPFVIGGIYFLTGKWKTRGMVH